MVFTLQVLHTSDQEAGIPALQDAIGLSAVMNALSGQYENTLRLTSGDVFISGPFFSASADLYDSASGGEPAGQPGLADILIQNELGWDAAAVGNHEFTGGAATFFNLLAPNADWVNGAQGGQGIPEGGYAGASFPYLATNLDYSAATLPDGLSVLPGGGAPLPNTLTSSVIADINGTPVGILGAVTPYLPAIANIGSIAMTTGDDITSATPITEQVEALVANLLPEIQLLQESGINKIILMTHLQEAEIEQALAQRLAELGAGVDIHIGGGSHRVMTNEATIPPLREDETQQTSGQLLQPYPQAFSSGASTVYYVNTGANYRYLSQLVATFDDNGVITEIGDDSGPYATDIAGVDRLYDEAITTFDQVKAVADPELVAVVDGVANFVNALDGTIFGQTDVFLNGIRGDVRTQETNLGNLSSDANDFYAEAYLDAYGDQLLAGFDSIDISFRNGGGIRDLIGQSFVAAGGSELVQLPPAANPNVGKEEGDISQLDISNSLRFDNSLSVGTVTAAGLYEIAEHMVARVEAGGGQFGQIGGFQFSFDPAAPARTDTAPGQRIQNLALVNDDGSVKDVVVQDGALLGDPERTFSVVTLSFLAGGGDSYPLVLENLVSLGDFTEPDSLGLAALEAGGEQDALAEFLAANFNADNGQAPYAEADTPREQDERIQNLDFREDTILGNGSSGDTFAVESGVTSVFLDLALLESAAGLSLVGVDSEATPFSDDFQVGFAINDETDFTYTVPFSPAGGSIEHDGTVTFALVSNPSTQITVGEFSIGFDAERASDTASGFFIADTLPDNGLEILFDISAPGLVEASQAVLTLADTDLLLAPEFAEVLGLPALIGADVGDARVDASTESDNEASGLFLDLRDITGDVATSFIVNREAASTNVVGFYRVTDTDGGIDTTGDGVADLLPGEASYTDAALAARLEDVNLTTRNLIQSIFDLTLPGGELYAPFLIADGTFDNFDPNRIFFAFPAANPAGFENIRFRDGAIEFEDIAGGGDQDFNDIVLQVQIATTV
jgi:2',3'-cyclic-nucleotide 2'-phosphodiesterase (5'-nucleotidase family)